MAKIAVEHISTKDGQPASECKTPPTRLLAAGEGWKVCDVICTAGPGDRAFEEEHSDISIAVVVSGTFQYWTSTGRELMTPGSILLGNIGEPFSCSHDHGIGDRCVSFHYSAGFGEQAGIDSKQRLFCVPRIPAIRSAAPQVAGATRLLSGADHAAFEDVAYQVFDRAMQLQDGLVRMSRPDPSSLARVTRVLRAIEAAPDDPHSLADMAAEARLSQWHFLRRFEELTGTTPRQYLLRMRLRRAAIRLTQESTRIADVALDCGFGDVSNFNHAFRAEFGESPRSYRSA